MLTMISGTISHTLAATKPLLDITGAIQAGKVNLTYRGKGQPMIAFVQKQATISVKRGENKGRTITHVQTVSVLRPFRETMSLPDGFNTREWEMITLLQLTAVIS